MVSDFLNINEEPYFILTDSPYVNKTTKVDSIDFQTPTYHHEDIYKQGIVKFKNWKLDKNYISELIGFFQSPCDSSIYQYNKGYEKYVKTNWQQLIYEYNQNTAGWKHNVIKQNYDCEVLPFDLPMPNYIELLNDK